MMRQRLILVAAAVVLAAGACAGHAQERRDTAAQREAMKKLDFWVGEWTGTGWYQAGPGPRRESAVTETIRPKLGGLALLVEGAGKAPAAGRADAGLVHDALGIIYYDEKAKRYRFAHFRAGDKMEETELKLTDGALQWERKTERGTVRFTAKIDGDRWQEAGEFSADGTTWHKFMEMTLQRQKPDAGGKK